MAMKSTTSPKEIWQLYNEQGLPLVEQGAFKHDIFSNGLLHGAAHVWLWRAKNGSAEILLQKRAAGKQTWPNKYDISAAGHINLGEDPLAAAIRETKEEIGLDISQSDLRLFSLQRANLMADNGYIENEFQWLYLLETTNEQAFNLQATEVAYLEWKTLLGFKRETLENKLKGRYVPHGDNYFSTVITAVETVLTSAS